MYLFGELTSISDHEVNEETHGIVARADEKRLAFQTIKINEVIDVLDRFSKQWVCGSPLFEDALNGLQKEISFSTETIKETLSIIPQLLSREVLTQRIEAELGSLSVLDEFTHAPHFDGRVKAFPLGTLLHVSAGNVFLGCIDSLLMGFLTKNISIIKLSSKNQFFPQFFAEALRAFDQSSILSDKFCLLTWRGGKSPLEVFFKNNVKGIIAWGGEEMQEEYRKGLPSSVKLFDYGPKISIQVLSKPAFEGLGVESIASNIAKDICIWDQSACASPQNLFIESGVDVKKLIKSLSQALTHYPLKRGELSSDEAVEILKEEQRAKLNLVSNHGYYEKGKDFLIHFDPHPYLRPSPLNRTLIIKEFKDQTDLVNQLKDFSFYLQSCSYALLDQEKDVYLNALSLIGMKRFSPLGTIMNGLVGAPHDGRYGLRELVQYIPDERTLNISKNGYFFASGGTTGNPKFSFYSFSEFRVATSMIAFNFEVQGLKPGMICANLFAPGQMWSSFLAVDKALESLNVVQLPIGGATDPHLILSYLERFSAEVILGIPSLIIELAEFTQKTKSKYKPKMVFYAGEQLNATARTYLESIWSPDYIGSAAYASVDAGVIGYQCIHSLPGEHHLFSKNIELEIINDEAVVSAPYRKSTPVNHLPTGDAVVWVKEPCLCQSKDPKFKILGRIDSRMNVFGCRLTLLEIEEGIKASGHPFHTYQLQIQTHVDEFGSPQDQVTLAVETAKHYDGNRLLQSIYSSTVDVKKTISFEKFCRHFKISQFPLHSLARNPRTGKIKAILDLRI